MMRKVFADASFYIALVGPQDNRHADAVRFANHYEGVIVTTEYILVELGAHLSRRRFRPVFSMLASDLLNSGGVEILPASTNLLRDGLRLFAERLDKNWSLTDCISFNVMNDAEISEALTFDHHFEQAGFHLVLE